MSRARRALGRLLRKLNVWWPWTTPTDRRVARGHWEGRAATIRATRIRQRPEHRWRNEPGVITSHGADATHCVCNGTHVPGGYCPRCPQPYWIAGQVTFL